MKEIFEKQGTFLIYKHSPNCCGSARARENIKELIKLDVIEVDVLDQEILKMEIAQKYNIRHESPQVLVIKDQKCIDNFSHHAITRERLISIGWKYLNIN